MRFDGYTSGGAKEEQRGLLASGDIGHFEGELLFVEGREDDMIVSGGENVYPQEVEELLAEHPGIAEVAVVGMPDSRFGQALRAFVVTKPGTALDEDAVQRYVRERLARFKVPRSVRFLEQLPRNATGKVLRRELRSA
jgi:fatty-acyl-CoA synthase